VLGERLPIREMGFRLAVGAASGIYYFIPVLIVAVVLAVLLSGHPRALALVGVGLVLSALPVEAGYLMRDDYGPRGWFFWELRNPLRWWGYFFAGWLARPACAALITLPRSQRVSLGVAALLLPAASFAYTLRAGGATLGLAPAALVLLNNYGAILGMLLLGSVAPQLRPVRWLSGATYPLYLYHLFVVQLVLEAPLSDRAVVPVAFVTGLLVTSLLVIGARRALGALSPAVIG
jgi:peptidoglycan/LPS O-acetylase OafA/YrhL